MRYVVTGAGMLGTALAARLRNDGHSVVVVDVLQSDGVVQADLRDRDAMGAAVNGADGVFHTAALHGFHEAPELDYFESNVAGTWTLLAAMAQANVQRLVHSSTIGVYGTPATIGPDTPAVVGGSPYDESKRIAEQIVEFFGVRHGIATVCLRYGAFRELLVRTFGEIPTDWGSSGAVVELDDVVESTIAAMHRLPLPRPAYIVAPTGSGTVYTIDASATEADLGVRLRPFAR